MSQAHIPQPDTTSAAGEVYDSTQSSPPSNTISAIGVPGPPPQEVIQHTTSPNNIDQYFYEQFIYCGNFNWSTSDPVGKMMWKLEISPKNFNSTLAHLAAIYNTWGGGVTVNIQVAGTGFHAGKLAIARIPPNLSASNFVNFKYTNFEWMEMDVKTLQSVALNVQDQRQVNYHLTVPEKNSPRSWDIGGTVAIYCFQKLNTGVGATQQVNVVITTKLNKDFVFSQIKPPNIEDQINTAFFPPNLLSTMDFSARTIAPAGQVINKLVIQSVKDVQTNYNDAFLCYGLGANLMDKTKLDKYIQSTGRKYISSRQVKTIALNTCNQSPCDSAVLNNSYTQAWTASNPSFLNWETFFLTDGTAVVKTAVKDTTRINEDKWEDFNITFQDNVNALKTNVAVCLNPISQYLRCTVAYPQYVPPVSESIVVFSAQNYDSGVYQTLQIFDATENAYQAGFKLEPGQCAQFTLFDKKNNIPLMPLKLHRNGVFTTIARNDYLRLDLANLKLDFIGYIAETDVLATTPQMQQNLYLAASIEKYQSLVAAVNRHPDE
ncbi:hypothetical protein 2 [Hubei picorna-like virus 70]|uniref:hypothetical protein 2 n=1 Tax=Hubei picorna-like virus 70 TaxID=1923154 RepID=UPI00090AB0B4|nr:hypothetical protein 2 [Hubei picorna-like virus 70]APG77506.1 hypothetical protein 2 [Hubei picorna-like virus 70]